MLRQVDATNMTYINHIHVLLVTGSDWQAMKFDQGVAGLLSPYIHSSMYVHPREEGEKFRVEIFKLISNVSSVCTTIVGVRITVY